MGFITLTDGTVVHTQVLNPNPVVEIRDVIKVKIGNIAHNFYDYIYRDGTIQRVEETYTITNND